jgi:hypothetical protein
MTLRVAPVWLIVAMLFATTAFAAEPPALAKARALYNAADYEGAISAAATVRTLPGSADAAALVVARAYLERFRQASDTADLVAAREAFASIDASALTPRDHIDLLVGLGQSLYLGEMFGPAAEIFDTALSSGWLLGARDRFLLLDWWASALERQAQARPPDRRAPIYERIAARMRDELRQEPGNAPANYWLAAAARGMGDTEASWNAAVAAWVRAGLSPQTAASLRADLDRLVTQALIPERARERSPREVQEAQTALLAEWDTVKSQWK